MNNTAMVRARLTPNLKEHAENVFRRLGLNITRAITLFYPFDARAPTPAPECGPALEQEDPICRARGMLKGREGGTASFMRDKQDEIEREYHS